MIAAWAKEEVARRISGTSAWTNGWRSCCPTWAADLF